MWQRFSLKIGQQYSRQKIRIALGKEFYPNFVDAEIENLIRNGFLEAKQPHPMPGFSNGDLFQIIKDFPQ